MDCWTSLECISLGGGSWIEDKTTCSKGESCRDSTGQCESIGNYECSLPDPPNPSTEFKCHGVGLFPSPFNCNEFYECTGENGAFKVCPENYAFDAYTGRCSKKLENKASCKSQIPICRNSGQKGNLTSNPNMFYLCTTRDDLLIPEIYSCEHNFYFNGETCVDPTPDVVDEDGKCIKKGLFYFSGDCKKYRECTAAGVKPAERTCTSPTRFDPTVSKCVSYDCSKGYINV